MKRFVCCLFLVYVLLSLIAVAQQSRPRGKTQHVFPPSRLGDVKQGMGKDTVISGLKKEYELKCAGLNTPGFGNCLVESRETAEQGSIDFDEDGKVTRVWQQLTPGYTQKEAVELFKDFFRQTYPHSRVVEGTDPRYAPRRRLDAKVYLVEGHTPEVDFQRIFLKLPDVLITISAEKSPGHLEVIYLYKEW